MHFWNFSCKKEYRKILRIHKWISENNFSYPEWNCSFSKHCIHPFFAPILGWLGVFLTGSDTSSCALFGGMQKDTAIAVGMSPELAVASNASGGVTAKMISPQSLSVATAATNMVGQEGNLFRFTIGHSIAMTLVLCLLTYLQAGPLAFMLP